MPKRNASCPCGSGKKYKHCCGSLSRKPKRSIAQEYQQDVALIKKGSVSAALSAFDRVLELDPNYINACHGRGNALYGLGDMVNAQASHQRFCYLGSGEIWGVSRHILKLCEESYDAPLLIACLFTEQPRFFSYVSLIQYYTNAHQQYSDAFTLLRSAEARASKGDNHNMRIAGLLKLYLGDPPGSLEHWYPLVAHRPDDVMAHCYCLTALHGFIEPAESESAIALAVYIFGFGFKLYFQYVTKISKSRIYTWQLRKR